jgi:hypothetical protein
MLYLQIHLLYTKLKQILQYVFFFMSKFKSQNLYNPDPSPKLFGTSYILESTSSLKK